MNLRKIRIKQWIIAVIVALVVLGIGQLIYYKANLPEKQQLTLYAPSDMQEAFEEALNMSELTVNYKIVMSDDPNSNICVEYGKQGDETYQKFAFSPFVVAYNESDNNLKKLKKSGVCKKSAYNSDCCEIDFIRIIDEVVGAGKWENLGLEDQGELKVFYPDKESVYWSDFYDFLLVTLNDGSYPEDESIIENIEKEINKFLNSKYTEGVTDFNEQVKRTGGFPSSVIYILPEKEVKYICWKQSVYSRIIYPTKTVYVNYYVKGDELGKQVIEALDRTSFRNNFYESLKEKYYRSIKYSNLMIRGGYIKGESDVYNVVKIPPKKQSDTDSISK